MSNPLRERQKKSLNKLLDKLSEREINMPKHIQKPKKKKKKDKK